ncbi:hypothetical protein KCU65_g164, partial [Aureobasidium melanogenum]
MFCILVLAKSIMSLEIASRQYISHRKWKMRLANSSPSIGWGHSERTDANAAEGTDGEVPKPVFQKDGSLSVSYGKSKSKMSPTKTLERSLDGRMTRRLSRFVVLPLLTSEQGCVFAKEAWSKSQSTKSRFITCQGLILDP